MRKMRVAWMAALMAGAMIAAVASAADNVDEAKAGAYRLLDPLVFASGEAVGDAEAFRARRRWELMRILEENQFGKCPPRPAHLAFERVETDAHALEDHAIRKQVLIHFGEGGGAPVGHLLIYLPTSAERKRVPVLTSLSFCGVHQLTKDPAVRISDMWNVKSRIRVTPGEQTRGDQKADTLPIGLLLQNGIGVAVMYYGDVEPDFPGGWAQGVRSLTQPAGDFAPDDWGAVAAWGWGLSRIQDYLETDPQVDAGHTIVYGMSRLGKASLWAGARDERFAMVIDSCSGEGGASLSHRNFGETVADVNNHFPHWFCGNYKKYSAHPEEMPFDSHFILSLIAPRPLFLNTGSTDLNADPRGVFLAARAAEPVYRLLGSRSTLPEQFPPLDTVVGETLAFHCHTGGHTVPMGDWERIIRFVQERLGVHP